MPELDAIDIHNLQQIDRAGAMLVGLLRKAVEEKPHCDVTIRVEVRQRAVMRLVPCVEESILTPVKAS